MMTNIEINMLCAQAVGVDYVRSRDRSGENDFIEIVRASGPGNWGEYDPINNNDQAMELVKRFHLNIQAPEFVSPRMWHVWPLTHEKLSGVSAKSSLNMAICGCVSKMQLQRIKESLVADVKCVCGEPTTLGVVHRTDGPCFRYIDPATEECCGEYRTCEKACTQRGRNSLHEEVIERCARIGRIAQLEGKLVDEEIKSVLGKPKEQVGLWRLCSFCGRRTKDMIRKCCNTGEDYDLEKHKVRQKNLASYHGDIDGDFNYW